ncbi:MAG: 4Fe-4S dicluster domain-containing protein [Proteobacteria bacterium]|nr:4Fe-4S dicluster domain-containing protein [Pseudomonadota bacterium]MBU1710813.1 4Fe-4S dicluster domain-containing protein [Pseudomonadota bacterium]
MNDTFILKKDHLTGFLRRLKKAYRLVAPVKNRHGDTLFTEIVSIDATAIDLENQAQSSVKPFLFPQEEVLFTYSTSSHEDYHFKPDGNSVPTVYFGLRSCDLSAILYMDVAFSQAGRDPYYLQKRKNAILVSLGCNNPFENCFCNATKNGPFLEYGFDLQLTDLGDRYFVEVGRAQGQEIIDTLSHFFSPAGDTDKKAQYQAFLEARGNFQQFVHVDQALKRLAAGDVPNTLWADLSLRCQDCAGCAYICPTCVCFTIKDKKLTKDSGARIRSWDACTFSGFTRMAGGHNPVDPRTQAIRKRFLHKMLYDPKKHGRPSCVGCGRCVNMCFGGVDIIRFINRLCE